jgi:hypothetical protein
MFILYSQTKFDIDILNKEHTKAIIPKLEYEAIPSYIDTPERIVLISSTPDNTFGFFTPLTAFLWKRMGWKVVVIAIGTSDSWDESAVGSVFRDNILESGAKIVYFPHHKSLFRGFGAGSIAQVSRILAGVLPDEIAPSGSYILTSDADIWTFKPSHFTQIDFTKVCVMHAEEYAKSVKTNFRNVTRLTFIFKRTHRFPMTYIGAKKESWKEIIQLDRVNMTKTLQDFHANIATSGLFLFSYSKASIQALCSVKTSPKKRCSLHCFHT